MNKIPREGLSIVAAFSSGSKQPIAMISAGVGRPVDASHDENIVTETSIAPHVTISRLAFVRQKLKTVSRPVARRLYHFMKPFIGPIAVRIRRYLLYPFQQHIELKIQSESARILEVIHKGNDLLLTRLDRIENSSSIAARRAIINCGADEVLVGTPLGPVLCNASDHVLLARLIDAGWLGYTNRFPIHKFLTPGDTYVDVGASVGLDALAAAIAMQGLGRIIAFEAHAPTMRMLEKTISINGFSKITEVHCAVVADISGRGKSFRGARDHPRDPTGTDDASTEIDVVRMDEIIPVDHKIHLIKIDAGGAEPEVARGGASLMRANPDIALIVQYGYHHLQRRRLSTTKWLHAFTELGLRYQAMNSESGALEPWSVDQLERARSTSLIFYPADSRVWERLHA